MSADEPPAGEFEWSEDHLYFRTIEETFIRLRGAPLQVSPADWQVARSWHRRGIPLALVLATLEQVFEKRRLRGAKGRFPPSLRYCADAVEGAWALRVGLLAPVATRPVERIDCVRRLTALAAALPEGLEDREVWQQRVLGLIDAEDPPHPERIERGLGALDQELLESLRRSTSAAGLAEIADQVEAGLERIRRRAPDADLDLVRRRIEAAILRSRAGLGVLSLFAPEAAEAADR